MFRAAGMVTLPAMRIVLNLTAVDPPVGTAAGDLSHPVAFSGWLGLFSALHALVPAAGTDAGWIDEAQVQAPAPRAADDRELGGREDDR